MYNHVSKTVQLVNLRMILNVLLVMLVVLHAIMELIVYLVYQERVFKEKFVNLHAMMDITLINKYVHFVMKHVLHVMVDSLINVLHVMMVGY